MLDAAAHLIFDRHACGSGGSSFKSGSGGLDAAGDRRWWRSHLPLWSRGQAAGINCSLHHWSRCEVPFFVGGKDVLPHKCVAYSHHESQQLQVFIEATQKTVRGVTHDCKINRFQTVK